MSGEKRLTERYARGPMSEATMEAVCRMYVSGAPIGMISQATGRSVSALTNAIKGPLARRIEVIKESLTTEAAAHYFDLVSMLPEARAVIRKSLSSRKEEIALSTAWKLDERLMPQQVQRSEHAVVGDPQLVAAISAIARSASEVADAARGARELRVRTASEALPAAFDIQEVKPAEPARSDESAEPSEPV